MARDIGGAGDLDLHDTGVCAGRVRMVALHLAVRKRNPLGIVDVCALVACVVIWSLCEAVQNRMTERCLPELFFAGLVWSLWFVFRVLWSLRFETSKWVLGILNGLLPLGWLEFRVC